MGQKTTTRHKESNTFRFETFAEKLRAISTGITANYRDEYSAGRLDEESVGETQLSRTIEKWSQLNLTASFDKLIQEIGFDIRILPQIVHDQERLTKVVLKHLCIEEIESFEPTTQVALALCADLGTSFHSSIPTFIEAISNVVMESGAPPVLEKGFQCMAYFFKYGRRHVLQNMSKYFVLMLPLLTAKKKGYLKVFAAQSMELVASTVWKKSRTDLFVWLAESLLPKYKDVVEGISMLLFSMMKGTADSLKLAGVEEFQDCVILISNLSGNPLKLWVETVIGAVKLLIPTITKEYFDKLWNLTWLHVHYAAVAKSSHFECLLGVALELALNSTSMDVGVGIEESLSNTVYICPIILADTNTQVTMVKLIAHILRVESTRSREFDEFVLSFLKLPNLNPTVLGKLEQCLMEVSDYTLKFLIPISDVTGQGYIFHFAKHFMVGKQKAVHRDTQDADMPFTQFSLPLYYLKEYSDIQMPLARVHSEMFDCCSVMIPLLTEVVCQDYDRVKFENAVGLLIFISRTIQPNILTNHQCKTCLGMCEEFVIRALEKYYASESKGSATHLLKIVYFLVEARGWKSISTPSYPPLKLGTCAEVYKCCNDILTIGTSDYVTGWVLKTLDCVVVQATRTEKYKSKPFPGLYKVCLPFLRSSRKLFRTLALSILKNASVLDPGEAEKEDVLKIFLEIESMSHISPSYSTFVCRSLEELSYSFNHAFDETAFTEICLSYIIGLLHVKNRLIWPQCQKIIQNLWRANLVDSRSVLYDTVTAIRQPFKKAEILEAKDNIDPSGLEYAIEMATFGAPHNTQDAANSGHNFYEKDNELEFWSRLWPSLVGLDEIPKNGEADLTFLLLDVTENIKFVRQGIPYFELRLNAVHECTALPYQLAFISKCTNLRERMKRHVAVSELHKAITGILLSKNTGLVKVAMGVLIDLDKRLQLYREHLMELIQDGYNPHGFLLEAVEPIIKKPEDREAVMNTVILVLSQKFRDADRAGKAALVKLVAGFKRDEAKSFIDWTIGSWLEWPVEVTVDLKHLNGRVRSISMILNSWKYKFPELVRHLIKLVCRMTRVANMQVNAYLPVKDADPVRITLLKNRRGEVLSSAYACLYAIFHDLPKLEYELEDIEEIFEVLVEPMLPSLENMSTGGKSAFLKLLILWGSVKRYHVLLTKYVCIDGVKTKLTQTTIMDELFKLLNSAKVHYTVKGDLMNMFLNMVPDHFTGNEVEEDILEGLVQESSVIRVGHSHLFSVSPHAGHLSALQPIGLYILLHGRQKLISFSQDKALKAACLKTPESIEKYFKLLQYILPHVSEKAAVEVGTAMSETFSVSPKDESALLSYFRTMKLVFQRVRLPESVALKLSRYFTTTKDRVNRVALCEVFENYHLLTPECKEAILALNSWSETDVDSYDFEKRQRGVELAISILERHQYSDLTYAMFAYNFFFVLRHESHAVPCRQALKVFDVMADSLAILGRPESPEGAKNVNINNFIGNTILKELRGGLQNKDIMGLSNYILVLESFIRRCSSVHGTLQDLLFLLDDEESILTGLCDIKVNNKTIAMNKLGKDLDGILRAVPFKPPGARVLLSYVLPLALMHMDTKKEGKGSGISMDNVLDNLVDSSIKVVKAIMKLLSPKAYVEYLNNMLANPPKDPNLLKRYKRQLIAVMDGFHYTLRPAAEMSESVEDLDLDEESNNAESNGFPTDKAPLRTVEPENAESCIRLLQPVLVRLQEYLKFKEGVNHKLVSKWREDNDIMVLQVECTVGLVKLLQKLPINMAKNLMTPVIPTICAYMKSKDHSKRRTSKATLIHLLKELGPKCFPSMVSYLEASLKVGFQLHVLNHVLSSLLTSCENSFVSSPWSLPIKSLVSHCETECFGIMAEEKTVGKIIDKTYEARTRNSEPILRICAKYATTVDVLKDMISVPLKRFNEVKSDKRFSQVKSWLASVNKGLIQNNILEPQFMLEWFRTELVPKRKAVVSFAEEPQTKRRKSTYELNEGPSKKVRDGPDAAAILVHEFALQGFYNFLNNERVRIDDAKEFRILLVDGLKSTSKEVLLLSLRCAKMLFLGKVYSFADDELLINSIWRSVVLALSKYCYASGDNINHEMVNAVFKCISTFLEAFPEFLLMQTDLKVLLNCIESFLTNGNCSTTALNLLQGVFDKRIKSEDLTHLMNVVLKESVRNHSEHVVTGCRKAYLSYTLAYNKKAARIHKTVEMLMEEAEKAKLGHEEASIIDTVQALVLAAPEGVFSEMSEKLLWFAFMKMSRPSQQVKGSGLKLLKFLMFREEFLGGLIDFADLFHSSDFEFHHERIIASALMTQALNQLCPNRSHLRYEDAHAQCYKIKMYYHSILIDNRLVDLDGRITAQVLCNIEETVRHYIVTLGQNWDTRNAFCSLWEDLIEAIIPECVEHEHPWVKAKSIEICYLILSNSDWSKLCGQLRIEGPKYKICFLRDSMAAHKLIESHINAIKSTSLESNVILALKNLSLLTQLVVLNGHAWTDVPTHKPAQGWVQLCTYLVNKVRSMMKQEVVIDATSTKLRHAGYQILQSYIGFLGRTDLLVPTCGQERQYNSLIPDEFFKAPNDETGLERIKNIVEVAVRDSTDRNLEGPVKVLADSILRMINKRIGDDLFQPMHSSIMKDIDARRKAHRTKKAQTAVLHPEIKRKRSAPKNKDNHFLKKRKLQSK